MNKTIVKIISIIIFVICLCTLLFSAYKIYLWYQNNNNNKNIKKKTEEAIKIDKINNRTKVDFNNLKSQNPDTVGYLQVKGTNIDYVVVKGQDNDYYLNHNFNREYNESGWVYADYTNRFDETDKNIVIYAHNTMDGSMFGSLKNVLNSSWYNNEDNYDITFITEKGQYTYRVFSVYQIEAEDYYIQTSFPSNNFDSFIKKIKDRSINDFQTEITPEDKILTLSTCSLSGKERIVVHSKLINFLAP